MKERHVTSEIGSAENLRHLRLSGLLRDLVRQEGRMEAAELLGVNYKTLAKAIESGRLTPRLSDALERLVLEGEGSAAARQDQRTEALEQRVESLENELRGGLEELRAAVRGKDEAPRDECTREETPVVPLPTPIKKHPAAPHLPDAGQGAAGPGPLKWGPHRRLDPLVVPEEPEPDDEEVYAPAWPAIEEWRSLRRDHPHRGRSLSWLVTEERILGLELVMLEEHGLTLPPEVQPLRGFGRNGQINWRRTALYDTRRARARRQLLRWVRRVLTLGLWWR